MKGTMTLSSDARGQSLFRGSSLYFIMFSKVNGKMRDS